MQRRREIFGKAAARRAGNAQKLSTEGRRTGCCVSKYFGLFSHCVATIGAKLMPTIFFTFSKRSWRPVLPESVQEDSACVQFRILKLIIQKKI